MMIKNSKILRFPTSTLIVIGLINSIFHLVLLASPSSNDELLCQITNMWQAFVYDIRDIQERARQLSYYRSNLGPNFDRVLQALGPQNRWVDLGSGESLALLQYARNNPNGANVIGIDAIGTQANTVVSQINEKAGRQRITLMTLFFGLRSNEIDNLSADLMTDVFGVITYTPFLSLTLANTLNHLRQNGQLMMAFPTRIQDMNINRPNLAFQDSNGAPISTRSWFEQIRGVELSFYEEEVPGFIRIGLRRRNNQAIQVPILDLVEFSDHFPPVRIFQTRSTPTFVGPE